MLDTYATPLRLRLLRRRRSLPFRPFGTNRGRYVNHDYGPRISVGCECLDLGNVRVEVAVANSTTITALTLPAYPGNS